MTESSQLKPRELWKLWRAFWLLPPDWATGQEGLELEEGRAGVVVGGDSHSPSRPDPLRPAGMGVLLTFQDGALCSGHDLSPLSHSLG